MENNDFKKNLDLLMKLFKKLRNKDAFKEMLKKHGQMTDLDMIINNYEMLKNNIPDEVANAISGPIKHLIKMLENELKDELDNIYENEDEENIINKIEKKIHDTNLNKDEKISEIDEKLRNTNLSDKEIDELLDLRNKILN